MSALELHLADDSLPPYYKRNWLSIRSFKEELAALLKLTAKIERDPLCGHWPFKLNPGEAPGLSAVAWLPPPKPEKPKRKKSSYPRPYEVADATRGLRAS